MELQAIDHFAISVKNLQTSFDWYQKAFGFELFHQWKTTWLISLGDMKIGLFERPDAVAIADIDKTIAIQHVAFRTSAEGLIQAQVALEGLKVDYDGPEDTGVAYSIFINDPDGHLLEITTYYEDKGLPPKLSGASCSRSNQDN